MFINTGYTITNTPIQQRAGWNTWPYAPPASQWYQHTPKYFIDERGNVRVWDSWKAAPTMVIPGGQYKGTPTRTGAYYLQNTIVAPCPPHSGPIKYSQY